MRTTLAPASAVWRPASGVRLLALWPSGPLVLWNSGSLDWRTSIGLTPSDRPGFNQLIADYIATVSRAEVGPAYACLFEADGRLRPVAAPAWARQAIVARDRARCARCGHVATGSLVAPIVPLAKGGMNDITNLELRCATCRE